MPEIARVVDPEPAVHKAQIDHELADHAAAHGGHPNVAMRTVPGDGVCVHGVRESPIIAKPGYLLRNYFTSAVSICVRRAGHRHSI